MTTKNEQPGININASPETLKGVYASETLIGHTKGEFLLDFITNFFPQAMLVSRVVIAPHHARRLLKALQQNIENYEKKFGEIKEDETYKPVFKDTH